MLLKFKVHEIFIVGQTVFDCSVLFCFVCVSGFAFLMHLSFTYIDSTLIQPFLQSAHLKGSCRHIQS